MKKNENVFTLNFTNRMVESIGKVKNNISIIKHYGTYRITPEIHRDVIIASKNVKVIYHSFNGNEMVHTLEPFLSTINSYYSLYYSNMTVDEFLSEFEIYPIQKIVFKSYLEKGYCYRDEPYILDEILYEKKRIDESAVNILVKLSKKEPMLIMIDNLNAAPLSTIRMILSILEHDDNENIAIFAAYNDINPILPFMVDEWNELLNSLEQCGKVYEGGTYRLSNDETESGGFIFDKNNIGSYIVLLNSMYYAVDFEQALYYFGIIYNKIEQEKIFVDFDNKFELFRLYTLTLIFSDDIQHALLLCDSIKALNDKHPTVLGEYYYFYLLSYAQMYRGKIDDALESAKKCREISKKLGDEFTEFKAEMLYVIAEMSGWHQVFFFLSDMSVTDELIEKAENYGFYNHLAHIYIYAYDNDFENYKKIKGVEDVEERLVTFSEGIDLAKNIGNTDLVIQGYAKNTMLTSTQGRFDLANIFNMMALDVINDPTKSEYADICNGIGYVNCTMAKYRKSIEYYNKALDVFIKNGKIDFVGETLYNMSIACILAGDNENAYSYLLAVVRIIENLNLNNLRVCNISKIYGLLALASINLNLEYNCIIYLETVKRFLNYYMADDSMRIKLYKNKTFLGNDDELFLYHYVSGIISVNNERYDEANKFFKQAEIHSNNSSGNLFFSYIQLHIKRAQLFDLTGNTIERDKHYELAYAFAKKNKYKDHITMIEALMRGEKIKENICSLPITNHTMTEINVAIKEAGMNKKYIDLQNKMDFLGIWQNILDINDKSKEDIIMTASNTFVLNFNLDTFTYIKFDEEKDGTILYTNAEIELKQNEMQILREYFEKKHSGFCISKLNKNFYEYKKVIGLFGNDYVCSLICNPYFVDEKLDSLFIGCIFIKDNWNVKTAKYFLDEDDFNLFNLALRQLISAVEKKENLEKISKINDKLQKSSITDYLTGLKNRAGFYEKINRMIRKEKHNGNELPIAILYIDLDNFKFYNDTFGHDVGDLILKEIALILGEMAGTDGFATRYGGDEFIITLINCDEVTAMATARMTLDTILSKNGYVSQISNFLGQKVEIPRDKSVSCSIGVAINYDVKTDTDLQELINHADDVLYSIKHTTKNDIKLYTES